MPGNGRRSSEGAKLRADILPATAMAGGGGGAGANTGSGAGAGAYWAMSTARTRRSAADPTSLDAVTTTSSGGAGGAAASSTADPVQEASSMAERLPVIRRQYRGMRY